MKSDKNILSCFEFGPVRATIATGDTYIRSHDGSSEQSSGFVSSSSGNVIEVKMVDKLS